MPRLPTAEQLGDRPLPRTRPGVAQIRTETPELGHGAAALADFGQAMKGVGDSLMIMAEKERKQLDAVRAEEATNTYLDGLAKLELDEKEGFTFITGGDAVKRPLLEEYRAKRTDLQKRIREGLASKDQQMAFDQRAVIADRLFDGRLYRHVADQSRAYQGVVYEGTLATEERMAAQMWNQPGQIELSLLRINKAIDDKARRDGLDPERQNDRMVIETLKSIARSKVYSSVIDTMLVQGKDKAASAFYEQIKGNLTPESLVTLGAKVEGASTDGESMRAVDTVWAIQGPKGPNDPVNLAGMEQWIRDQYKDEPRVARAAIQELRSRLVAHKDTVNEVTASNKSKVLDAFQGGLNMEDIFRLPEYQALNGTERAQVTEYMRARGYTEQQRARSELEYQEGDKARLGFGRYWELSHPTRLSTMSEAQILALEPELGRTLTGNLMEMKRKLSSPREVMAANIDTELFNSIAAEAGMKPYEKNLSAAAKEQLGRLRNSVEATIDLAQQQKGAPLTRAEKEELMRREVDRKVMLNEWGRDPKMPAAAVPLESRENVYVPIGEIDPGWMKGAINYMRSVGAAPMAWSDAKVREKYRDRLERAYGLSMTGGSPEEGRKLLEGR